MADLRTTLEASLRAGEKITRTAERLLSDDNPVVHVPRYVEELARAARFPRGPGDPNLYEQALGRWQNQIARLGQGATLEAGEYTIQSATRELVKKLKTAKPEQVDKLVDRWVLDKARYQARVVARNESVEAMRESGLATLRDQEWVHGVRWTLSPAHPRPDICDMHAGVDLHGLGPGGYPLDDVPDRHPSCLCTLVPIADDEHFEREIAKAKGEPEPPRSWESGKKQTTEDWLKAQPLSWLHAIIGPTRTKLVLEGRKVYEQGSGFIPVHQLLGKPKPLRQSGPRIDARPHVAADRKAMVRPFPNLGQQQVGAPRPTIPKTHTVEHWAKQTFEYEYTPEVKQRIAWGKAVYHRGLDMPMARSLKLGKEMADGGVNTWLNHHLGLAKSRGWLSEEPATIGEAIKGVEAALNNPGDSSIEKIQSTIDGLRKHALYSGHVSSISKAAKPLTIEVQALDGFKDIASVKEKTEKSARFYQTFSDESYTKKAVPVRVRELDPETGKPQRAYAAVYNSDPEKHHVMIGAHTTDAEVVHEHGHVYERHNDTEKVSATFIEARVQGPLRKLSELTDDPEYRDNELAREDKFFNEYVGKEYRLSNGEWYATEVVSMGAQHVYNGKTRLSGNEDFFHYVLGQLAGGKGK